MTPASRRRRSAQLGILATLLTLIGVAPQAATAADEDLLTPTRLYNGADRPIPVVLALRGRTEPPADGFTLLLLGSDGQVVDQADGLRPGEFDLATVLPVIPDLVRTARVQVIADGEPIGTPLVVQPLIVRPLVRTVRDTRPDGKMRYTRIIGYGETLLDPERESDRLALEEMRNSPDWEPGDPIVASGFRVYPDRDVVMETDFGEIRIDLAPEAAPNTAWNFRHLAENGFYDDTIVHRVVHYDKTSRRFVIQGGDPTGTGDGGPGWDLPIEPSTLRHDLGVISMARADHPDSAGSQWFIALSREGTARLDGQYCAFGWATTGDEAIARIADVEIGDVSTGRPTHPPRVARMKLVPAEPLQPGSARESTRIDRWWTPPEETRTDERRPR